MAEAAVPPWFMPLMRRTFRGHGQGQLLQWLELCNTPGKGKITPQPLYEFMADKVGVLLRLPLKQVLDGTQGVLHPVCSGFGWET